MPKTQYIPPGVDPTLVEPAPDAPGCRKLLTIGLAGIMFVFGFIISLATHASAAPTPTPTGTIQPSQTATFTPTVTPTPHVITATPGALVTFAPGTPTPGQCRYTVRAGDTLAGIAARYNTSSRWLAAAAHVSQPDRLAAGQTLSFNCYSTPTPTGDK